MYWTIVAVICAFIGGTGFGFLFGVTVGKHSRRASPDVRPICPCGHSIGEHNDEDGCQADILRSHYWSNGYRNGNEWVQCSCLKYWGPQPLTELFSQGTFMPRDAIEG